MSGSPTQRSLKLLRDEGYTCQIVEKYNQFARVRIDLFGFIDIVCLRAGDKGLLGVQTTSTANINARVKKIKDLPVHRLWLEAGNRIEVQGFSKKGKVGKVKHWVVKRIVIE